MFRVWQNDSPGGQNRHALSLLAYFGKTLLPSDWHCKGLLKGIIFCPGSPGPLSHFPPPSLEASAANQEDEGTWAENIE